MFAFYQYTNVTAALLEWKGAAHGCRAKALGAWAVVNGDFHNPQAVGLVIVVVRGVGLSSAGAWAGDSRCLC